MPHGPAWRPSIRRRQLARSTKIAPGINPSGEVFVRCPGVCVKKSELRLTPQSFFWFEFDQKRTRQAQDMPADLVMEGRTRGWKEVSNGKRSRGAADSSKRGKGGVGGKLVFECTLWGKAFSSSNDLTRHERTHSGDRPYANTTCGQTFSVSSNLTKHMRTHSGDCPYACTTCCMAFSPAA